MSEYIILIPLVIMHGGLTISVIRDKYIGKTQKNIMLAIVPLVALLLVQNCGDYICQTVFDQPACRTLFGILGYSLRPVILVLFCKLVQPERKHFAAWIAVICNALLYLTALFSDVTFKIDELNHFVRGPLSYTAHCLCAVLILYLLFCTIFKERRKRSEIWITILNAALVIAGTLADLSPLYVDYPVSYLTVAVVCSSPFYYIWMHLEFVHEHEKALIAEQRIKIMMSQIRPHFLYNTLTIIQSLCLTDPKAAFETTGKFGAYLRNNLDSLEQENLIPIQKELDHTKLFADIESLRFPSISVEYHIEPEDFYLPALTIQPLVENAIRHGARSREHGVVEVAVKQTESDHVITISDNGEGFDTEKPPVSDGTHIGIANVRERLKELCGRTLTIESRIGEGTVAVIKIPRSAK